MLEQKELRFENFNVPSIVDETLREGVERCAFPISAKYAEQKALL